MRDSVAPAIYGRARNAVRDALDAVVRKSSSKTPGVDGRVGDDYVRDGLDEAAAALRAAMAGGRYRFSLTRQVNIPKPAGGLRTLSVLTIADRAVETSVRWVLEPLSEMPETVHGFIKHRGTGSALDRIESAMGSADLTHVLEADVEGFFPSIAHSDVFSGLSAITSDKYVHRFVQGLLCRSRRDGQLRQGLLQGSPLSPLLSNLAFKPLDLQLSAMAEVIELSRYADDVVLMIRGGLRAAEHVHRTLGHLLNQRGLSFAAHKTHLRDARDWSGTLGHVFRRDQYGCAELRPSPGSVARLREKLTSACLTSLESSIALEHVTRWLPMFRKGWCSYFRPMHLAEQLFDGALASASAVAKGGV